MVECIYAILHEEGHNRITVASGTIHEKLDYEVSIYFKWVTTVFDFLSNLMSNVHVIIISEKILYLDQYGCQCVAVILHSLTTRISSVLNILIL